MDRTVIDGYEICRWKIGPSEFEANVRCGARLTGWRLKVAGSSREVIYWNPQSPKGGFGEAFSEARGGNPILFPFAGRSFCDGRDGFWRSPEGAKLPMHLHGYASMGEFEESEISENGFKAHYLPNSEAREAYPYNYDFFVEYVFSELSAECRLTLENRENRRIPWGAGTHFYFTLPWHTGLDRKNYRIVHDAKIASHTSKEGLIVPSDLLANSFDNPEIHNRVLSKLKTGVVKFGLKSGEEDVSMIIDGGGKPRAGVCVVTWAESDKSPYYCVESWMSPPRSAEKPVHFVEPNGIGTFSVKVSLE